MVRASQNGRPPIARVGRPLQIFLTNSKEKEQMENELKRTAAAAPTNHQEQPSATPTRCPVTGGGARRHTVAGAPTNAGWWPDQLNLKILHQHSSLSDPMDKQFNYAEEFKSLNLHPVIKDLHALLTA